jgi:hypothetical protein
MISRGCGIPVRDFGKSYCVCKKIVKFFLAEIDVSIWNKRLKIKQDAAVEDQEEGGRSHHEASSTSFLQSLILER